MIAGQTRWYKKWWIIALLIVVIFSLSLAFAFALYFIDFLKTIPDNSTYLNPEVLNYFTSENRTLIEGENNYWIGSANPKVVIVEFADFGCSYCAKSFPKIREIDQLYGKDVKHIYRDFPAQGDTSVILALAGRCAGEQGLFWLMHDKLFQNQGVAEEKDLVELANQIGADTTKFDRCLSSKKYLNDIQKDFDAGENLGVSGTPTWFINGQKVEGDIPLNIFIQIVEEMINNQK